MLRKLFSLGALVVVAVTFGAGNAAAKQAPPKPGKAGAAAGFKSDGFSDGREHGQSEGFSDGRM